MDPVKLHAVQMIAELARAKVAEHQERFLDAACENDLVLRKEVEMILRNSGFSETSVSQPMSDRIQQRVDPQQESIDSIALVAISTSDIIYSSIEDDASIAAASTKQLLLPYCDSKRLSLVHRLKLFQRVCLQIDLDHRRGKIHGDLNPFRMQIAGDRSPILKLSETSDSSDEEQSRLRYLSPEQVLGEPVSIATDVYALGVLLYELLTGRYPYHILNHDSAELYNAISVQAPQRPSQAVQWSGETDRSSQAIAAARGVSLKTLKQQLVGDLELIVLCALRKEPETRYASLERFVADIDAFLNGYPVTAHQDSRAYRTTKFLRRHKLVTTAGFLTLSALVITSVGTTISMRQARRDANRATSLYYMARKSIDELLDRIDGEHRFGEPGFSPLRASLLEPLLRYYELVLDQSEGGLQSEAEAAFAQKDIARIDRLIGLTDIAAWQYENAMEHFQELISRHPQIALYKDELLDMLINLGEIKLAMNGHQSEARQFLESAFNLLESASSSHSETIERQREHARIQQDLAQLERFEGHLNRARIAWTESLQILTDLVNKNPQSTMDKIALATAKFGLGRIFIADRSNTVHGISLLNQGIELREKIIDENPERTDQVHQLALELSELAALYQGTGDHEPAQKAERRSLTLFEQLDRRFPKTADFQTNLYLSYDRMSRISNSQGDTKGALEWSERARVLLEQLVKYSPRTSQYQIDLARCYSFLGRLYQHEADHSKALEMFQHAVDMLESCTKLHAGNHYELAVNLSHCIMLIGNTPDFDPSEHESKLSPGDRARRQVYGTRAVAALRQAIKEGFANVEVYQTDTELDPLRDRPDFQRLVMNLLKQNK